jgi:hypothetical protein
MLFQVSGHSTLARCFIEAWWIFKIGETYENNQISGLLAYCSLRDADP